MSISSSLTLSVRTATLPDCFTNRSFRYSDLTRAQPLRQSGVCQFQSLRGELNALTATLLFPHSPLRFIPSPGGIQSNRTRDPHTQLGQIRTGSAQLGDLFLSFTQQRLRLAGGHWLGPVFFSGHFLLYRDDLFRSSAVFDVATLLTPALLVTAAFVAITALVFLFTAFLAHVTRHSVRRGRTARGLWLGLALTLLSGVASSHLTLIFNRKERATPFRTRLHLLKALEQRHLRLICTSKLLLQSPHPLQQLHSAPAHRPLSTVPEWVNCWQRWRRLSSLQSL